MGDTGSMGIGGAIAALAMLTRTELLLLLIGGLFIVETGSVILQRVYFKLTKGKRIFRMSPIHHHFELKGWVENTVVVRFWLVAGLFVIVGIGAFYTEWLLRQ
jgi:phospho-N-acetylmuramoyl-pentapeptide-transferase